MRGLLIVLALSAISGCRQTRCDEYVPEPNAGDYRGGGSLGEERMLDVSLKASTKEVVLSYRAKDGSQIRAFYRVAKKIKR